MRTERYREASARVRDALRRFARGGAVEQKSCDDFYLLLCERALAGYAEAGADGDGGEADDMDGGRGRLCTAEPPRGAALAVAMELSCAVLNGEARSAWCGGGRQALDGGDRAAVCVAAAMREAVWQEAQLSVSVGVARTKLAARLASPLAKPAGVVLVRRADEGGFVGAAPLARIPGLGGKAGADASQQLCAERVRDLPGSLAGTVGRADAERRFGRAGSLLAALAAPWDFCIAGFAAADVMDRSKRSLLAEKSFPPERSREGVRTRLQPLLLALARRLELEAEGRRPRKLVVGCRRGYGAIHSRSADFPRVLGASAGTADDVEGVAARMWPVALRLCELMLPEHEAPDVTRLCVTATLDDAKPASGALRGQRTLFQSLQAVDKAAEAVAENAASPAQPLARATPPSQSKATTGGASLDDKPDGDVDVFVGVDLAEQRLLLRQFELDKLARARPAQIRARPSKRTRRAGNGRGTQQSAAAFFPRK